MKNVSGGGGRARVQRAAAERPGSRRAGDASSRTGSTRCASSSSSGCCAPARRPSTRRGLRGLLHLGAASEEVGDAAQQLVWLVEEEEEMHPVLAVALGEADEVVVQYPIAPGSALDGAVVAGTQVGDDTGFHLLAIRRAAATSTARGPRHARGGRRDARDAVRGRAARRSREQCGFRLVEDDDTGAVELVPGRRRGMPRRTDAQRDGDRRREANHERDDADERRADADRARGGRPCAPAASPRPRAAPPIAPPMWPPIEMFRHEEAEHELIMTAARSRCPRSECPGAASRSSRRRRRRTTPPDAPAVDGVRRHDQRAGGTAETDTT